jgi:hypothetical protein
LIFEERHPLDHGHGVRGKPLFNQMAIPILLSIRTCTSLDSFIQTSLFAVRIATAAQSTESRALLTRGGDLRHRHLDTSWPEYSHPGLALEHQDGREPKLMEDHREYHSLIAHGLPQGRCAAQNSPDERAILDTGANSK